MATFRLRKPGGGSALRGGDGFRAQDKRIYEYAASGGIVIGGAAGISRVKVFDTAGGIFVGGAADVAFIKSYAASGGIAFNGAADTEYVDGRGYVASGGLVYGGAAGTQFVAAAAPADHGGGFYTKTPAVPIRRRQYGHPVTFLHRADGGLVLSGKAQTAYARHSVTHEAPAPTGGIRHGGAALTEIYRPEEEILLLLAA